MLVTHHQPILPPSLPSPPEYSYNAHISSPSAVQLRSKPINLETLRSPPKSTSSFTIRPATIDDARAIAHLGATVFSKTFGFSIPTNDLNAFLDEAYTVEAIEEDIRCPTKHLIVACATPLSNASTSSTSDASENTNFSDDDQSESAEVIGFAQLTELTTEPCLSHLPSSSLVELQRLYVSTAHHGRGVGNLLAREIERLARDNLQYRALWLGVWEGNFHAQRVYESLGFVKVGDHEFKMGSCIQMDWIMCKDL